MYVLRNFWHDENHPDVKGWTSMGLRARGEAFRRLWIEQFRLMSLAVQGKLPPAQLFSALNERETSDGKAVMIILEAFGPNVRDRFNTATEAAVREALFVDAYVYLYTLKTLPAIVM